MNKSLSIISVSCGLNQYRNTATTNLNICICLQHNKWREDTYHVGKKGNYKTVVMFASNRIHSTNNRNAIFRNNALVCEQPYNFVQQIHALSALSE